MQAPEFAIPILDWASNAGGYGGVRVDDGDPRARDPLVRVGDYSVANESFYARIDGGNSPYNTRIDGSLPEVWCRKLVAEKLGKVNQCLRAFGKELFVWDAYRPIATQQGLWSHWEGEALRKKPDATPKEIQDYVLQFVSDPRRFRRDDSKTWPVHSSGGAVDLTTRCLDTGRLDDMGCGFDEMGEICHSDYFERQARKQHGEAVEISLKARRLLHWAMTSEGFVNYPPEYWHFDWGDQMYVHHLSLLTGKAPTAAWYGYADPPSYA